MLGIDIVDLRDSKLKNRDERALKLILNEKDELISHKQIYWILWAAKEAVFKCRREANNFSPTQIQIKLREKEGKISFTSNDLSGKVELTNSYVLSVCTKKLENIKFEIFETEATSNSSSTRGSIVSFFKTKDIEVSIGADNLNLPTLLPFNEPISISHHGNWSAFVYPKSIIE